MFDKIILASKSQVRKKILEENGINCIVKPSNVDEEPVKNSLLKEGATPEIISKNLVKKGILESVGSSVMFIDGDSDIGIGSIKNFIHELENSDLVIGSRFLDESEKEVPQYRKVGIKVITKLTNASIKKQLTDSQSGFRAYSKKVLNNLSPSELGMGISTEILIKASSKNFRITEVPIKILYTGDTSTHNPVSHGTSVLISTIKFTSIEHPLKFYGIPSVIFLIIGSVFTYYTISFYTEIGRLNPNLALIAVATILVGIVLLISAILLFSLVSVVREKR